MLLKKQLKDQFTTTELLRSIQEMYINIEDAISYLQNISTAFKKLSLKIEYKLIELLKKQLKYPSKEQQNKQLRLLEKFRSKTLLINQFTLTTLQRRLQKSPLNMSLKDKQKELQNNPSKGKELLKFPFPEKLLQSKLEKFQQNNGYNNLIQSLNKARKIILIKN